METQSRPQRWVFGGQFARNPQPAVSHDAMVLGGPAVGHGVHDVPQLAVLPSDTHTPLHAWYRGLHWMPQAPRAQVAMPLAGTGHGRAHPPQCATSVVVSTQVSPQNVPPPGHTHAPATQLCAGKHVLPHAPQWELFVATTTQTPPQSVWPAGHTHAPATQVWAAMHCVPQAPQWEALVRRSTHAVAGPVPQTVRGALQPTPQVPPLQSWPLGHCVPHAPQ